MTNFTLMPFDPFASPSGYVYTEAIALAVNVAFVTDRVLLVRGEPGTGKSTLAEDIASRLGFSFHAQTVTSRTEARDLLWSFDNVQRLNDAYARSVDPSIKERPITDYLTKGVLWKAFESDARGAVALLDEIDKADPDVPNDLLVPLDRHVFRVDALDRDIMLHDGRKVLVVVTTNGERDLPQAFLRRCITIELARPTDPERLTALARAHFRGEHVESSVADVIRLYGEYSEAAAKQGLRAPATAEFLDAVRVLVDLRTRGANVDVNPFVRAALWKHREEPRLQAAASGAAGASSGAMT